MPSQIVYTTGKLWDNEMGRPQTLNMGEGRIIAAVISILY